MAENKFAKYKPGNKFAKYASPPPPSVSETGGFDAFKKLYGEMQQPQVPSIGSRAQFVDDLVRSGVNGLTFGYADKAAAKGNELLGFDQRGVSDIVTGSSPLARERQKSADAKQRTGLLGDSVEIAGSMVGPGKMMGIGASATKIPGLVGKLGGSIIDGAGYGTLNAAGHDQNLLEGAGVGAVGGLAGQLVGAGASKLAGLFNKKPVLPTASDLASKSDAAYRKAENAGVIIKPQAIDRLRQTVHDDYANFGYHPELQPGAKVAYGELDRLSQGGNVDLKGLDGLRKITGKAFNPTNPSNNELLRGTTNRIDDFLENLAPNDVLAGDPQAASAALKDARKLWAQKSKLSRVDELLGNAELQAGSTGSGGNIENASRQQLKKLLTNKKLTRGMTPDEVQATKNAVLGTKTQNALRLLGKLSPQGNGLMMAVQGGGLVASGGMTLPLAVVGYGAKKASESMTKKNAELLRAIIASGGKKSAISPKPNATQKLIDKNKDLIRLMIMGGGLSAYAGNSQ